jgi:hypothetical protein
MGPCTQLNGGSSAVRAPFGTGFSTRGLFARSSNDVRHRCCATGDARRAHDRHRVETGRWEPPHGPEREGARLAFLAYKSRRTVVGRRPGTSDVCVMDAKSNRHANGPDSMKRGRVPRRTTSDTVRRDSPFRVMSPHEESRAEHLPWRSNDVRTSCEVDSRRPRGATFPVVARRSRTVVKGRRGKRSKDGTPREAVDHRASSSRAPNAPNAASPPFIFGLGRARPVLRPFSPPPLDPPPPVARSTTHPSPRALFTRVLDVRSSSKPRPRMRYPERRRKADRALSAPRSRRSPAPPWCARAARPSARRRRRR